MRDVHARHPEADAPAGWDSHLVRYEREHQRRHLDFDRAVGHFSRRSDPRESTILKHLGRIDRLDMAGRVNALRER